MNNSSGSLLSSRLLRINVGFLLSSGAGNTKDMQLNITEPVRIAEDLTASYSVGNLRLSRNKEGLLVQSELHVGVGRACARCLDEFEQDIQVHIEELYAYPRPIADTEFFIGQDAKLDLAPLLRAEVLIELSHKKLCRPDCQGLCPHCGINLNHESCDCVVDEIDPRMAKLKELLDSAD